MVYLGLAICIRSEDVVIEQPKLSGLRMEVHTVDHANAPDDIMCIASPLRTHQFYFTAVNLGKHRIIKEQVTFTTGNETMPDSFPYAAWTNRVMSQKIAYAIMVERFQMIFQISTGIIDLTGLF